MTVAETPITSPQTIWFAGFIFLLAAIAEKNSTQSMPAL